LWEEIKAMIEHLQCREIVFMGTKYDKYRFPIDICSSFLAKAMPVQFGKG
jgi:hypothetical protein